MLFSGETLMYAELSVCSFVVKGTARSSSELGVDEHMVVKTLVLFKSCLF